MKTGLVSVTFSKKSIEEVVKIAKEAHIDGIEWSAKGEHAVSEVNIDKIKQLSKENGLEIFAFGSYCYMTDLEECMKTVDMGVRLSAPVIRIWPGRKSPTEWTEEEFVQLVENTRSMASYAAKYQVTLAFEYHRKSLTETAESAIRLIKAINRENVKLYWQNSGNIDLKDNLLNLKKITPYLCGHFHIQNNYGNEGNQLLAEIEGDISKYYEPFLQTEYKALIEFVKGGLAESFYDDAETLNRILKGEKHGKHCI